MGGTVVATTARMTGEAARLGCFWFVIGISGCGDARTAPPFPQPMRVTNATVSLGIGTDLSVPKDFDSLELEQFRGDDRSVTVLKRHWEVGTPSGDRLPLVTHLAREEPPSGSVRFRVSAWTYTRELLSYETQVDANFDGYLDVWAPLDWLCLSARDRSSTDGGKSAGCPDDMTCFGGACVPIEGWNGPRISPGTDVFGGGNGSGDGRCFDTIGCFSGGTIATLDPTDCSFPETRDNTFINVAIVAPPGSGGICTPAACLIPLDREGTGVWPVPAGGPPIERGFDFRERRVVLAPAVCERVREHAALGVAVSSYCLVKNASIPTCGPWSSVTTEPGNFDPHALDGLVAGLPTAANGGP